MSAIVNDRDVLLAGSSVRFSPPTDRAVLLGASANSFRIAAGGGGSPATITLSAVVLNMTGNVVWAVTPAMALTITGNQAVLKLADMPADSVVVTASLTRDGVTYEARQTIFKTYDGSQGLPGTSTGIVQAYKRAVTAPTDNPGVVTFTFSQGRITTPGTDALANGWTKTIPAGTDPLYVCVCSASGTADNDTIAAGEWAAPVLFAQSGINAATVFLYRKTTTNAAPAKPGAAVMYTFATGMATGMDGGWTQGVPPASDGAYLWVTTATAAATGATDTIAASEWATVQLMARNGDVGVSNAVAYAYKRASAAPTDNPGAVTYSFPVAAITNAALANGWSKTIPAGTDPLYLVAASASGSTDTDDIAASEWTAPVLLAQSGTNGLNTATVYLYRRTFANVAPQKPTATVTYTFATAVASGMDGGWTQTVPAASGGDYLWVTTATAAASTATDIIAASEWAAVQLMAKNGSDGYGYDGQRGTVDVVVQANYWPADTYTANTLFHSSGYTTGPYNRDRMTLTNGSFSETRFYDDSSGVGTWKTITAWINGNMVVSGTLSADMLNGGTIRGVVVSLGPNKEFQVDKNGLVSSVGSLLSVATVGNLYNPTQPAMTIGTVGLSTQPALLLQPSGTGDAINIASGKNGIVQSLGGPNWLRTVVPNGQNAFDCGSSDFAWRNMYTYGAVITVSDRRLKTAIEPSSLGLAFINDLRPVSYRMVLGRHDVIDHLLEGPDENGVPLVPHVEFVPVEGVRRHYGLIAQEVRETLVAHGADDAAFWTMADPADPESNQALRYEELISPLIRAVQELSTRLQLQEQEIKQLKGV